MNLVHTTDAEPNRTRLNAASADSGGSDPRASVPSAFIRGRFLRSIVFRLAAVLLGLAPLLVLEAVLTVLDLGRPSRSDDPFVAFSSVQPLFVLSDDGTHYEIPRSRRTYFHAESFAAKKPADEFRIFVIGDSTVQGNPWSIETSFTTWLELSLNAADPRHRWRVVNCGGISYASYRMVPIVEELLHHQPDLLIIHSSHNEFLEDRSYHDIKQMPRPIARTLGLVAQLRSYNLLRAGAARLSDRRDSSRSTSPTVLAAEVEALLDYRGGLEQYHRDDAWRAGVIAHYEHNLRRMVRLARDADVPLMLMNPVSNLRDSPPFKSQHGDGLSDAEAAEWESLWTEARQFYNGRHRQAVPPLERAIEIDDQHAGLQYDLAKCYDAVGRVEEARERYIRAKELDICPLRILEPMNEIVRSIARETRTPLLDAHRLFEGLSRNGIPGGEWLVDHVHPSIRGYQTLGDALADELVRRGIVRPVSTWQAERDRRYAEHLASLDSLYFARGQQHLDGLMAWAQGRAQRERPRPPRPSPAIDGATP